MKNRETDYIRTLPRTLLGASILFIVPALARGQIWSEEFDSGSQPSADVWTMETGGGGWGNNELQTYTNDPANVRVEGGHLIITAIAEESSRGRPGSKSFSSGRIKSEGKLTVQYGTIEARIMLPDLANGLWPAFWLLGSNFPQVGWPDCGELDVMEMGFESAVNEGVVNRRVGSTAHWDYAGSYAGYGLTLDANSDLNGSWHVFRMEWTPTLITTYLDNTQIWAFDISDPASFGGEEFHQPYFILVNMAVGGTLTGLFGSTDITAPMPAELRVDYIRVYDNGYTVLGGSSVDGGGDPPPPSGGTESHVDSIVPGKAGGGPNARATADIVIVDENGAPVSGADVTATFSGSHSQTLTGTTDSSGAVTITTTVTNRNVSFTVCVDDVVSGLTYDSAANVETCDSY